MNHIKAKSWALVTGASNGIGLELAKLMAQDGISLALVARSHDKLTQLKKEWESQFGIQVETLGVDLAQPQSPQYIYDQLRGKGITIDILVNNAGFGEFGLFCETPWEKEAEMIQVNITALTHLTKLFMEGMLHRKKGKILNVASTAAFQPGPLMSVYYATKSYVLHFSEAIADELAGTGVSVTALCPGPTTSGFQAASSLGNSKLVKGRKLATSLEVAIFGYDAMKKGKAVAIHGVANRLTAWTIRFLPRPIVTKAVRKYQEAKF